MTTQQALATDRATVASLSASRQEPQWMTDLRLQSLQLAGELPLPVLEKTNVSRWNLDGYGQYVAPQTVGERTALAAEIQALLGEADGAGSLLVQQNSGTVYRALDADLAAQGVIFTDLESALQSHPALVQTYFAQVIKHDEHRIAALHTALWNGGVFLYVPKNVEVKVPLQALVHISDGEQTTAPHILIVADTNSSVTYVDQYNNASSSGAALLNAVVEVYVHAGAKVRFASVHQAGESLTQFIYRRAHLENNASIEWIVGELNDGNHVSETTSILKGNGSSSDVKVITVGTNAQSMNVTTRAVHFGLNSASDMITRGVMKDSAQAIINGITKIEKGATGAGGFQTERVLMLSPKARGDANPILLIDEDDVKAGHAASVGQVNAEQLYYLMSRGISKEEAFRLIVYGFLAPVVSEIPEDSVQNVLKAVVERKLAP
jgi:Fe-S cluster assembly protein SufD